MLVQVNHRISESQIRELIEYAVFFDDEQLERACDLYMNSSSHNQLFGLEDEGELVGVIGCHMNDSEELEILHLAVHPESRGNGYGRGLLLELLSKKSPSLLFAVTDEEGADFFRNVGFVITGQAGDLAGQEIFRCVYDVEEDHE